MFIVIFITAKLSILSSSSSSLISSSSWWSIRRWLWLWSVISLFVVLINISVLSRWWSHLVFVIVIFIVDLINTSALAGVSLTNWKLSSWNFPNVKVANHRFLEVLCNLIYLQLYFFFLKAMSSTKRLLVYTVPVTMVSFALNIPKFFEVRQKKYKW